MVDNSRYDNQLRELLERGQFVVSVEFVTPEAKEEFESAIGPVVELAQHVKGDPRIHTIALTDRVKFEDDHDPVRVAERVAQVSGKMPTVHLSGKDRTRPRVLEQLARARAAGLENLLLITGDKVKRSVNCRPVRYYDSVNMIVDARAAKYPFQIAAAVSPFKYREEELMNQYLKMAKKERAGADYFITQIGWDMLKFKELLAYRRRRGLVAPVMAGAMLLTARRARYIRVNQMAGITVTDALYARLESEAVATDRGIAAAYRRLALQLVGLKHFGYAGFQLTGLHEFAKIDKVLCQAEALEQELKSEEEWWDAWWDGLREPDGRRVQVTPEHAFYFFSEHAEPDGWRVPLDELTPGDLELVPETAVGMRKFRALDRLDHWVFRDGSSGARLLTPLARLVPRGLAAERALHGLEAWVKGPIVGCETCGFCRLPYTMYVCPETCPKGLANGPCGGTSENTCEFGDRECIHNRKYRIAKATGRLEELESFVIPAVEESKRGTCSWLNHFRGEDPPVILISTIGVKAASHVH